MTSSDNAGEFAFDDLPVGDYEVLAEYPGFRPAASKVQIVSEAQRALVRLENVVERYYYCERPNARAPRYHPREADGPGVVGQLLGISYKTAPERLVANAKVSLLDSTGGAKASTTSDSQGRFQFGTPPPGKYTLVVSRRRYKTQTIPLWVASKDTAELEIYMPP